VISHLKLIAYSCIRRVTSSMRRVFTAEVGRVSQPATLQDPAAVSTGKAVIYAFRSVLLPLQKLSERNGCQTPTVRGPRNHNSAAPVSRYSRELLPAVHNSSVFLPRRWKQQVCRKLWYLLTRGPRNHNSAAPVSRYSRELLPAVHNSSVFLPRRLKQQVCQKP
jgi:hypothetical protein